MSSNILQIPIVRLSPVCQADKLLTITVFSSGLHAMPYTLLLQRRLSLPACDAASVDLAGNQKSLLTV